MATVVPIWELSWEVYLKTQLTIVKISILRQKTKWLMRTVIKMKGNKIKKMLATLLIAFPLVQEEEQGPKQVVYMNILKESMMIVIRITKIATE